MIKREIATFRKGFGEGDLESLRIVLLFYNKKANLGSLSHYSIVHSSLKMLSASSDHLQNLKFIFRKFEAKHIRWLEEFSFFFKKSLELNIKSSSAKKQE